MDTVGLNLTVERVEIVDDDVAEDGGGDERMEFLLSLPLS